MPRTLGVDYGERRVGLAISDELGMMALPLDILPVQSSKQAIRDVLRLCQEKQVAEIVVGLPLNMDGSRGPAVEAVERFVLELNRQSGLPVEVWDERMSSRQVERMLIDADISRSKRKGIVDKLAAQVILQSYLDSKEFSARAVCSRAGDGVDSSGKAAERDSFGGHGLTPAAT